MGLFGKRGLMQMRTFRSFFLATMVLILQRQVLLAGKIPISPERLQSTSKLIVIGKVDSLRTEEEDHEDGSKTAFVILKVAVETVSKGDAKKGDSIEVRCWRVVKKPRDGVLSDTGSDYIPAPGGRAEFFLERQSGGVWDAQWPNGIKGLEGAASLDLPLQPADAAPASKAPPSGSFDWSSVLAMGGAGALLLLLLVSVFRSRRKPADAANP